MTRIAVNLDIDHAEAIRILGKDKDRELSADDKATLGACQKGLDLSTKFISTWTKMAM
jgi:hypothetical protein